MTYEIEFIKADKLNKADVEKGKVVKVSKTIRDAKVASGVAKDYTKNKTKAAGKK